MDLNRLAPLARLWALQMTPRTQRVAEWAAYQTMLAHFRADKHNFIFANIGCGLGDVSYRAIQDGIPAQQTISVDQDKNLWDFGKMVLSIAGPPPQDAPFVAGNLLDAKFLPRLSHAKSSSARPIPDLKALKTLAPLQNRVSAIFAERLFHILPFEQQDDLAARLIPLLVLKKGAMIFGRQLCGKAFEATQDEDGLNVFLHSAESWRTMWEMAFPKGTINVQTEVIPRVSDPENSNLWWSVSYK
ncbi:hypothetical protein B0H19DRAFT_980723 [Mycena capillaripes]|nr:hypothetical protein B0H19DRAFT_980723 [Mycena capillaripes]